jgi:hypothetical protein
MDSNTLLNLVRMLGGAQQPPMSPVPAPMSPLSVAPVRPAGVPEIRPFSPAPSSFNLPRPAAKPPLLAPAGAELDETPPPPPSPTPEAPVVGGLRKMMGADSGALGGVGSFLGDAFSGMGKSAVGVPPAAAFAQGFSGSFEAGQKRAAAAAEAKRQAAKDAREDKRFGWEEEDRPLVRESKEDEIARRRAADARAKAAEARAAKEGERAEVKFALELQKLTNPNLSRAEKITIYNTLSNARKSFGDQSTMSDKQIEQIDAEIKKLRQDLEGKPAAAPAPAAPPTPAPKPGGEVPMSQADPRQIIAQLPKGPGGLPIVSDPSIARALPSGTEFLDPQGNRRRVP